MMLRECARGTWKEIKRKKWIWCHPERETDWWICFAIDALCAAFFILRIYATEMIMHRKQS